MSLTQKVSEHCHSIESYLFDYLPLNNEAVNSIGELFYNSPSIKKISFTCINYCLLFN